jgi:hypothetical protein
MPGAFKRFQPPARHEDAILMVVSAGLNDFVQNTLASIARAGATDCMICIAVPANAVAEVGAAVSPWSNVEYVVLDEICNADFSWIGDYHPIRTDAFGRFTASKWPAIRHLLESGFRRVTYTDVDVAWIRNPLPLLRAALRPYDVAIQTEGTEIFPPNFCTGFMSFRNSDFTINLLRQLEAIYPDALTVAPPKNDQVVFNTTIANDPGAIHRVFGLSEQLFANGPLADAIASHYDTLPEVLIRRIDPIMFHANWCIGLAHKRALLAHTGNWLIEQSGEMERSPVRLPATSDLAAELAVTRKQLDAVYASRSWRMTALFRWAFQWLRRRLGGQHDSFELRN